MAREMEPYYGQQGYFSRYNKMNYQEEPYVGANMRQTRTRTVFLRTSGGHKTYRVDLDTALANGEWETKYLREGFRDPHTGQIYYPGTIQAVSVRDLDEAAPDWLPDERPALQWLYSQVNEVCALAAA